MYYRHVADQGAQTYLPQIWLSGGGREASGRLWHQPGEELDSTGPTQKGARQPQWRYSQPLIIFILAG